MVKDMAKELSSPIKGSSISITLVRASIHLSPAFATNKKIALYWFNIAIYLCQQNLVQIFQLTVVRALVALTFLRDVTKYMIVSICEIHITQRSEDK
jgi:hypothetical protein